MEPDLADNESRTPLSYTLERGNINRARALLKTVRVNLEVRDINSETPLSRASEDTAQ